MELPSQFQMGNRVLGMSTAVIPNRYMKIVTMPKCFHSMSSSELGIANGRKDCRNDNSNHVLENHHSKSSYLTHLKSPTSDCTLKEDRYDVYQGTKINLSSMEVKR
jgi:hypothetical protein